MVRGRAMFALFIRYVGVGVFNTAIHWVIFSLLYYFGQTQALSNIVAFIISVTFSFFANSKFTFEQKATSKGYIIFVAFMGILSALCGWISDKLHINPIITLVEFSLVSLIFGFLFSKLVVFRKKDENIISHPRIK